MNCEREGCEQPATVKLIQVSGGEKVEVHLCEACADVHALPEPVVHSHAVPSELVEVAIGQPTGGFEIGDPSAESASEDALRCPECKLSFQQFRRKGRLGCPACYSTFSEQLAVLLDRFHGCTEHVGTRPGQRTPELARVLERRQLEEQLKAAVAAEAFEEAARLRDRIAALASAPSMPSPEPVDRLQLGEQDPSPEPLAGGSAGVARVLRASDEPDAPERDDNLGS